MILCVITWHCSATHDITSHHMTSHYMTLHDVSEHHMIIHHIASHDPTSHHNISRHVTSRHITSHHITSHHITRVVHFNLDVLSPNCVMPTPPLMSNFMAVFGFVLSLTVLVLVHLVSVTLLFGVRFFFRGTHVARNVILVTRMPSIVAGVCLCTWLSHLSDTHEGGRQHQHCRT